MSQRLNQSGQTLIALLVFMAVSITITLAATAIAIINIRSNNDLIDGNQALLAADSGVEEALLQLERNPGYSGGSISVGPASAIITVSGSGTLDIVSVGNLGNMQRTVTATATYSSDILTLSSWSETP